MFRITKHVFTMVKWENVYVNISDSACFARHNVFDLQWTGQVR